MHEKPGSAYVRIKMRANRERDQREWGGNRWDVRILDSAWGLPSVCSQNDTCLALIQNCTLSFDRSPCSAWKAMVLCTYILTLTWRVGNKMLHTLLPKHNNTTNQRTKQAWTNMNTVQSAGARTSCAGKLRNTNCSCELFKMCLHWKNIAWIILVSSLRPGVWDFYT